MKPVNFMDKPIIRANAYDIVQMMNRAAKESNSYALDLMKIGIRSDVSAQDVIYASMELNSKNPIFNYEGNLTKIGRNFLKSLVKLNMNKKSFKEVKKVTVRDFLINMLKNDYFMRDNAIYVQKQHIMAKV